MIFLKWVTHLFLPFINNVLDCSPITVVHLRSMIWSPSSLNRPSCSMRTSLWIWLWWICTSKSSSQGSSACIRYEPSNVPEHITYSTCCCSSSDVTTCTCPMNTLIWLLFRSRGKSARDWNGSSYQCSNWILVSQPLSMCLLSDSISLWKTFCSVIIHSNGRRSKHKSRAAATQYDMYFHILLLPRVLCLHAHKLLLR